MRSIHVLAAAGVILSALAPTALAGPNRDFSQSLAQGYSELATYAVKRLNDQSSQSYFRNKSERAQAELPVDPEWPTNWTLAVGQQQAMGRERDGLIAALDRLDAGADPRTEAIAQVNFDCWVALSSIPALQKESARCRDAFHAAMQLLGS